MKCPQCQHQISEKAVSCPQCGYAIALYRAFQIMKNEVAQLHHEAASTTARLEHLQQRFMQVEKLMAKTLSQEQVTNEAEDAVLLPLDALASDPLSQTSG